MARPRGFGCDDDHFKMLFCLLAGHIADVNRGIYGEILSAILGKVVF